MANVHVTQDSTELAFTGNTVNARVTQDSAELAYTANTVKARVTQDSAELAYTANTVKARVTQDSTELAYKGNVVKSHVTQDSTELAWQQRVNTHVTQASIELAWKHIVSDLVTQDSAELAYTAGSITTQITQDSIELAWQTVVVNPNTITTNTFHIGDLVTQIFPYNNGIVQSVTAKINVPGSNTFYELGTLVIQAAANSVTVADAQGTLDAIELNVSTNTTTLYVSNTTGIFTNSGTSDVVGLYARSFIAETIQRINIGFITNADPRTGSFDSIDLELITNNNGALGGVIGANSSTIDVIVATGTFNENDIIIGTTSSAEATVLSFSNVGFNDGDPIAQKSQVIQIVNVQTPSNTGSYQIGELVYQQQKNFRSSNAITQNTMIGIIDDCNSTVVTMSSTFGPITNNSLLIGSNSNCLATINNVKTINTATGVVYSSNSSSIQITQVSGAFMLGHKIYGPNSYANLVSSLANIFSISSVHSAINTLDIIRGTGQLVITTNNSSFVVDANTGALANVILIDMTEE